MTPEQSDLLKWEIDYRRQKQWDIFSWCSALLVGIIGGTIALRTGFFASQSVTWDVLVKAVISFAVLVLVLLLVDSPQRPARN